MTDLTETFKEILKRRERQSLLSPLEKARPTHKTQTGKIIKFSLIAQNIFKVKSIETISRLLRKNQSAYLNINRHLEEVPEMDDEERQEYEREFGVFIKTTSEQIQMLQNNYRKFIFDFMVGAEIDGENVLAHFDSIVLFLREKLASVSTAFKKLQEIRLITLLDRNDEFVITGEESPLKNKKQFGKVSELKSSPLHFDQDLIDQKDAADKEWDKEIEDKLTVQEKLLLENENKQLFERLNGLATELSQAEQSLLEISSLQDQLEMHLHTQSQEIDRLFDESIQTTDRVQKGNKILTRATKTGVEYRNFMMIFFLLLSFILLFLHWYE